MDTPVEQALATINERRPDVVNGFGSAIGFFYRWAISHGREVWRPRLIVYGGDHLPAPDRQLIETDLGIPTLSVYQACEALMIAVQCERRRGFHVSSDLVHLRTVDQHGHELPAGQEGSLVLSNLVNRATVLLNYQLGDRGTLAATACSCGRCFPLLHSLQGRADDLLVRSDGQFVHEGLVLKGLHSVPGVLEVQVVQHSESAVEVKLVTVPGHSTEVIGRAVASVVRDLLGGDPAVSVAVTPVESIPAIAGGKRRMVISKCVTER